VVSPEHLRSRERVAQVALSATVTGSVLSAEEGRDGDGDQDGDDEDDDHQLDEREAFVVS
jgi:hypothetical protein